MTLTDQLSILTFFALTIASTASCQTPNTKANKQSVDSTVERLRLFRKIFWDSLPQSVGYVNDYENLYNEKEEETLDSLISDFEKKTTIQIALVTFDTTMTSKDSLDALTLRIGNIWGVGQKEKNNGVTIGICRGYRKMRIQNGYGIEIILTDAETKKIIDTAFIPHFQDGNYFKGTLNGLKVLMATLEEKSK